MEKFSSTNSLPVRLNSCNWSGSSNNAMICLAKLLLSPGLTRNPLNLSLTISGMPPARQATIGTPQAAASSKETPSPSMNAGCTTISKWGKIFSRLVRKPSKRTNLSSPIFWITRINSSLSGPRPKISTRVRGCFARMDGNASKNTICPLRGISCAIMASTGPSPVSPNSSRNPSRFTLTGLNRSVSTALGMQMTCAFGTPASNNTSRIPLEMVIIL